MVSLKREFAHWTLAAVCLGVPVAASGQTDTPEAEAPSREVVQALPRAAAGDLTRALMEISADPSNVEALLRAGRASIALEDYDAAIGFFTRARDLGTAGGRAKAGLASALVYKKMPVEALRLFAQAETEGARLDDYAGDYGLALDLVGDNVRAQTYYRIALAEEADPVITRRLALSQAIGGDQSASEYTLLPLLQRQDLASYRTRAFALAALGKTEEAVTIAEAIMPATLAARIGPYLRYMPNLTRAQQAAAANFGHFPEASQIGRDDPRIAEFARNVNVGSVVSNAAGGALVPVGEPLGPTRRTGEVIATAAEPVEPEPEDDIELVTEEYDGPVGTILDQAEANSSAIGEELPPAMPSSGLAPFEDPIAVESAVADATEGELALDAEDSPEEIEDAIAEAEAGPAEASSDETGDLPRPGFSIASDEEEELPNSVEDDGFDLGSTIGSRTGQIFPTDSSEQETGAQATSAPPGLADAFADFGPPPESANPAPGAVDVRSITPATPQAQVPPPPEHPARIWVQVATGRDRSALGFDWRRITRGSAEHFEGRDGFLVRWGRTNRLVTGPFDDRQEALDYVNELKGAGVDSFMFSSEEGEEVAPLSSR